MTDPVPHSKIDVTDDLFLGGQLTLRQPKRGHRAGHDAILLGAATPARPGHRVVEFGAGIGAAGLSVARRVGHLDLVLVEIDAALASLARVNAEVNQLLAHVAVLDVAANADTFAAAGLGPDSVDVVLMNPPFNDAGRHRASPDPSRQVAHMASTDTLATWTHAARRVLKPGGSLALIWRTDALPEVLAALARGFGSIEILPVHSKPGEPAIRVLVKAVKGGRGPLRLHPGLALLDTDGTTPTLAVAILEGRAVTRLAVEHS